MISDLYDECRQCSRQCRINRNKGEKGFCNETAQIRIALACLHFGEEPPISVFGGSGTIFFAGCNLRCAFCQNYQISQYGMGKSVSADEFIEICLKLQNAGAENINLVTASHIIPLLSEFICKAQNAGCIIPFCWNSSAYESIEMLSLLKDYVKIWLPDLKTLNNELSRKLFDAQDYPEIAASALKWMIKNFPLKIQEKTKCNVKKEKLLQGVIIRHLFLPGCFEETAITLKWLKKNANNVYISLMSQYTPVSFKEEVDNSTRRKKKLEVIENRLVNKIEDSDLRDLIDVYGFDYLFYQELSSDTSWLPDFNNFNSFPNKLSKTIWHWKYGFANNIKYSE